MAIMIQITNSKSLSPCCSPRLEHHSASVKSICYLQIVSTESSRESAGVHEGVWMILLKLLQRATDGRNQRRRESFWESGLRRYADSSSCEVFCAACSLVISFSCSTGGALRPDLDHRGTSLAKSVSKRKQRLHQIRSIPPTLVSFLCAVENYALVWRKYTSLWSLSPKEILVIYFLLKSSDMKFKDICQGGD